MPLLDEIRIKTLELQLRYDALADHLSRHPISEIPHKLATTLTMAVIMTLLARNRTFRNLYLTYNLLIKP